MTRELKVDDYEWMTPEEAISPPGGHCKAIIDAWWAVDSEGRIAFYNPLHNGRRRFGSGRGSPQCNNSREVAEKVFASAEMFKHFVGVKQFHVVFYRDGGL